jgi:hypothetical protein
MDTFDLAFCDKVTAQKYSSDPLVILELPTVRVVEGFLHAMAKNYQPATQLNLPFLVCSVVSCSVLSCLRINSALACYARCTLPLWGSCFALKASDGKSAHGRQQSGGF